MGTETRTVQTAVGETEIEVAVCDSCEQAYDPDDTYSYSIEDERSIMEYKLAEEFEFGFDERVDVEGRICENCVDKKRILGTPLIQPKLVIRPPHPDTIVFSIVMFVMGMLVMFWMVSI